MPIEHEIRDGGLLWVKNPISGVISYVVDVRGKSFAFTLGGREELSPKRPTPAPDALRKAIEVCPCGPGNERHAPEELLRIAQDEFPQWNGAELAGDDP